MLRACDRSTAVGRRDRNCAACPSVARRPSWRGQSADPGLDDSVASRAQIHSFDAVTVLPPNREGRRCVATAVTAMSPGPGVNQSQLSVSVLGPMRVWRGAFEVAVPTTRPRAVLALLLAQHGRPVSVAEIIGVLWPDHMPVSAVNLVQKYVGQLRRLLSDAWLPGCRDRPLSLERAGYRLCLDDGVVDLLRFRRDVAAATAHDTATLDSVLAALRSWSGPSFGDLPAHIRGSPVFEGVDSEYFSAITLAAELGASLGQLARVLPALQKAVAWRPLDETIHAWWILALAAAGRQAEALAAYVAIRQRLHDELGIDPGPELVDAQHRVLRQHPRRSALNIAGRHLADSSVGRSPLPAGRPPAYLTSLHGRDEDISRLVAQVASGAARLITITGLAGVGKTRLAAEVACRVDTQVPHVAWVSMAGVAHAGLLVDAVRAALSGSAGPLIELEGIDREPILIVLDNLEHLENPAPALTDLLSRLPQARILATNRRPTYTSGEQEWPLSPLVVPAEQVREAAALQRVASVQLFVTRLLAVRPSFAVTPDVVGAVAGLCRRLDGLPLAIELAAAQCRAIDPRDLLWRGGALLRDLPAAGGQPALSTAVEASYQLLDGECRAALRLLAEFRGGWSLEAATAVVGDPVRAAAALNMLAGHGMIRSRNHQAGSRYEMLETIRRHVIDRHPYEGDPPGHRHAQHFLDLAERNAEKLRGGEAAEATATLEADRDNLRHALRFLVAAAPTRALRMAVALYRYWLYRGRNSEGVRELTTVLGRLNTDSQVTAEPALVARAQLLAANLALFTSDLTVAGALATDGLAGYERIGDAEGLASGHTTLGMIARRCGDRERAVRSGQDAVSAAERSSDRRLLAICLNNLSAPLQDLGRLDDAARLSRRALNLATETGDGFAAAVSTHNLAENARLRGELRQADRFFQRAIQLSVRLGDHLAIANSAATSAVVKAAMGDMVSAEQLADTAFQHEREGDDSHGFGAADWARAEVNLRAGRPAAAHFGRAVDQLIKHGDYATAVEALSGLAVDAEPELAQRAHAAARFLLRRDGLYEAAHVRQRLDLSPTSAPSEFTAADLDDLIDDIRLTFGSSADAERPEDTLGAAQSRL